MKAIRLIILLAWTSPHVVFAQTEEEYLGYSYDKGLQCMQRFEERLARTESDCPDVALNSLAQSRARCNLISETIETMLSISFSGMQFPESMIACARTDFIGSHSIPTCSYRWKRRKDGVDICYETTGSMDCPKGDATSPLADPQSDWNCCAQWHRLERPLQKCERSVGALLETLTDCDTFLDSRSPAPAYFSTPGFEDLQYAAFKEWSRLHVLIGSLRQWAKIEEDAFECFRRPYTPPPAWTVPFNPNPGRTTSTPG